MDFKACVDFGETEISQFKWFYWKDTADNSKWMSLEFAESCKYAMALPEPSVSSLSPVPVPSAASLAPLLEYTCDESCKMEDAWMPIIKSKVYSKKFDACNNGQV